MTGRYLKNTHKLLGARLNGNAQVKHPKGVRSVTDLLKNVNLSFGWFRFMTMLICGNLIH